MITVVIVAVILIVLLLKSVIVVPADAAYVVERLGRYHGTLQAGLHVLAPFLDRIAFRYSLSPKDDEMTDTCITFDNVPISVTLGIRWQVIDPQRAAYASANVAEFVVSLVRSTARQWIGQRSWDDVRESTRELQLAVASSTDEPAAQAGVQVMAIEVKRISRGS